MSSPTTVIGVTVGNEYAGEYVCLRGSVISVQVAGNPVLLQLDDVQPPQPAMWWQQPIYLPVGPFSHQGDFGRFRFKNAVRGQPATITFSAYA